jgi:glucans biosynthesis protein
VGVKINNEKQPHETWLLNKGNRPLDLRTLPRCSATAKSTGRRCGNPAMKAKKVCYLHGGKSCGAPKGNKNALKHGYFTFEAIERRKYVRTLLKRSRELIKEIDGYS